MAEATIREMVLALERNGQQMALDARALSQVDDKGNRAVVAGRYRISLGGSQPEGDAADSVLSGIFSVEGNSPVAH